MSDKWKTQSRIHFGFPFRRKQAGKKLGTFGVVLAVCCYWAVMCRVAVVSGGGGGGGGEDVTVVMKGLHAHEHTRQGTQADAWPMSQCWLQMLAKGVWRATNVHPSKHEFARRVSVTRARKRPTCFIVGQSLQDYITTQLHSNVFRYMHSLFGGIGFPLSRISAVIVGCSLLLQTFEQLNCNSKTLGVLTIYA